VSFERDFIDRLESAGPQELAELLRQPAPEE
jgi:hypothetical protein